jgi:hypothetical protein
MVGIKCKKTIYRSASKVHTWNRLTYQDPLKWREVFYGSFPHFWSRPEFESVSRRDPYKKVFTKSH